MSTIAIVPPSLACGNSRHGEIAPPVRPSSRRTTLYELARDGGSLGRLASAILALDAEAAGFPARIDALWCEALRLQRLLDAYEAAR